MKKIFSISIITLFIFSASAQEDKAPALETIGAASGLLLYNTYLAIGTISDAYKGECYDAELASELAREQINSIDFLIKQYKTLLASGFVESQEDKSYISEMVVTFGYLKNEATHINAYIQSGAESDLEKYEYNRNEAWKKISQLLGFDEK